MGSIWEWYHWYVSTKWGTYNVWAYQMATYHRAGNWYRKIYILMCILYLFCIYGKYQCKTFWKLLACEVGIFIQDLLHSIFLDENPIKWFYIHWRRRLSLLLIKHWMELFFLCHMALCNWWIAWQKLLGKGKVKLPMNQSLHDFMDSFTGWKFVFTLQHFSVEFQVFSVEFQEFKFEPCFICMITYCLQHDVIQLCFLTTEELPTWVSELYDIGDVAQSLNSLTCYLWMYFINIWITTWC